MINLVRTILLNKPAVHFTNVPGSEYIDPSFSSIILPPNLHKLREILLPDNNNLVLQNYIVSIILKYVHLPDLTKYNIKLDPRITYGDGFSIESLINNPCTYTMTSKGSDVGFEYLINFAYSSNSLLNSGLVNIRIKPISESNISVTFKDKQYDVNILNNTARSKTLYLLDDYFGVYFILPQKILTGVFDIDLSLFVKYDYNISNVVQNFKNAIITDYGIKNFIIDNNKKYESEINELYSLFETKTEYTILLGAAALLYVYGCQYLIN